LQRASHNTAVFALVDAVFVAAGIAIIASLSTRPDQTQDATSAGKWALAAGSIIAALALVLHIARHPDGGNDAFIIWNLRARWMFLAESEIKSAFSTDILFWSHQDYPLMLPGLVARGFSLVHSDSKAVPAAIACLFSACTVSVVVSAAPKEFRWITGLVLVTTTALVMQGATEQADVPRAAFLASSPAILIFGVACQVPPW